MEKAWDGKALKIGLKFSIAYNTGNLMRQRIAEMIKTYMEMIAPGKIKVDVVALNWPSYLDAMMRSELPMPIFNWLADLPDPDNFIFTFYHSAGSTFQDRVRISGSLSVHRGKNLVGRVLMNS